MKKRKARRFAEGGEMPEFEREPLRDSSGEIVRDSSGQAIMSGSTKDRGYADAVALGKRMREQRDAAAMDEAMLRYPSEQKTIVAPVRIPSVTSASTTPNFDELETAGFSRTPLKNRPSVASGRPSVGSSRPVGPPRGGGSTPVQKPAQKEPDRAMGRTAMGKTAEQEMAGMAFAKKEPERPVGRTAMGKTVEQEMAAINAARQTAGKREIERLQKVDKPLERVAPEEALIGGAALRGLRAAGAGLASRLGAASKARVEPRVPPRQPDMLEMPKRRLPYEKYMGKAEIAKKATPRLPGQQEGTKRLASPPRGGEKDPSARRPTQDELDQMRMGSDFMRKGGKVGGASKRADGIAMRGKTRGRYI